MTAIPKIGHGAKIQYSTDGTTYTTLLGITAGDFGSSKADVLETTAFDTPGVNKTFTGGLFDPGDHSTKFNALPGDQTQATVRGWAGDGIAHYFKWTDSSNIETATFTAIVVSFDESDPDDKLCTRSLKLKIASAIQWGQAVAPSALSYATNPLTVAHGSPITPDDPTVTGVVVSYSVAPPLPAGLSLDPTTGIISGTPTATTASAAYVVTATNTAGTTTASVTIAVS